MHSKNIGGTTCAYRIKYQSVSIISKICSAIYFWCKSSFLIWQLNSFGNNQIDNLNNQLNQTSELQSELEQCKLDKDYCQSSLNQKKIDYSSIKETLQTCETKLSNCQQGTGQQSANLKKCMDDIAAYQKSLSSIPITLEQEKTGLVFIQTQYETSKTESENCRSLFCQKKIDCINMENDLKNKNLKTCESAKTICETGTTPINQELVRCKADAAVITTDNS